MKITTPVRTIIHNRRKHSSYKTASSSVLPPSAQGFTLLEIMIALAIIGATLTVVLHTVNFHASLMYENTVTTQMYQAAKEKLFDAETTAKSSKGKIGDTGLTYENIAVVTEDSDIVRLKTIVRGDDKEIVLTSIIRKKAGFPAE